MLATELKRWKIRCPISERDLCFPTEQGKPQNPVRFHDLRHGYASTLLASGSDLVRVQKLLGHASAAITLGVYAHAIPGVGDDVSSKLDSLFGAPSGSKTVAADEIPVDVGPQVIDMESGPAWIRTRDQGIMSPLL